MTMKDESFKLDRKLKTKWVKALRSGKYKQGMETLCDIDPDTGKTTFCCLGVLAVECGVPNKTLENKDFLSNLRKAPKELKLPISMQNILASFNDGLDDFSVRDLDRKIAQAINPNVVFGKKRGFVWIANWIEKYL
jgi:hypothetical protein